MFANGSNVFLGNFEFFKEFWRLESINDKDIEGKLGGEVREEEVLSEKINFIVFGSPLFQNKNFFLRYFKGNCYFFGRICYWKQYTDEGNYDLVFC